MTATLDVAPAADDTRRGGELFHLYCCDPNLALCGLDVTDYRDEPGSDDPECVVCVDLAEAGAPCRSGCPQEVA